MDRDKLERLRRWNGKYGIVFREFPVGNDDVWVSMEIPPDAVEAMTEEERAEWHKDFPPDELSESN